MWPRLREAYPGVAPWEWDEHPEWHGRVLEALIAEAEAKEINDEREKQRRAMGDV